MGKESQPSGFSIGKSGSDPLSDFCSLASLHRPHVSNVCRASQRVRIPPVSLWKNVHSMAAARTASISVKENPVRSPRVSFMATIEASPLTQHNREHNNLVQDGTATYSAAVIDFLRPTAAIHSSQLPLSTSTSTPLPSIGQSQFWTSYGHLAVMWCQVFRRQPGTQLSSRSQRELNSRRL